MFIFAYGSLIWRPGFDHMGAQPAMLRGYHRRFCIWSRHYRGTPAAPGLVLGLDRGGSCHGVVFEVPTERAAEVVAYLDARENLAGEMVYRRRELPVSVAGAAVRAITYVADRAHPAYGRHCPETTAWAIAHGHGEAGSNREYLENTLARLRALGLRDAGLERLARLVSAAGDAVHLDQRAAHQ